MKQTKKRYKQPTLLIHHSHTGRFRPKRETSYALLAFITLCVGVFLLSLTVTVRAANIAVTARVPGTPPPSPAIILTPQDGEHLTAIPISVQGTCPAGYIVKLYRNDSFSGSVICQADNTFSLQSDLFVGENQLKARIFNAGETEGPSSPAVTVYYDPPPLLPSANGPGNPGLVPPKPVTKDTQLVLNTDTPYRGYRPHETAEWTVEISGGTAPYAIGIDWGDGSNDVVSRASAGRFTLGHVYKNPGGYRGGYQIKLKASDAEGQNAYLQLIAIINDPKISLSGTGTEIDQAGAIFLRTLFRRLIVSWPFYVITLLMVISFWLGERRGYYLILAGYRRRRRHA